MGVITHEASAFSDYVRTDDVLTTLYEKLGPALLLPIRKGDNAPANEEWQSLTFDKTQTMPYLRELSQSTIAVACGNLSSQLCGIRFPTEEALNQFQVDNPKLAEALVVKGPSGLVLFMKIVGFCPGTQNLMTCVWLSDEAWVIVHQRDIEAAPCEFSGGPKPVSIAFSEIDLDSTAKAAIYPQVLAAMYGGPTALDKQRNRILNPNYWAHWYSSEAGIQYHPGQKKFVKLDPSDGSFKSICDELIMRGLQEFIHRFEPVLGSSVHQRAIADKELRKILSHMKIVAVGEFDEDLDALPRFLDARVERRQGADVTSGDLLLAYNCFCQNERLPALTRHEFFRALPAAMREKFGISSSHDLKREDGARRGYVNVSLRQLEEVERTARTARTG